MARGKLFLTKLKDSFVERLKILSVTDALDIATVFSLTLILKPVIQGSPGIAARLSEIHFTIPYLTWKPTETPSGLPQFEIKGVSFPNFMDLVWGAARAIDPELMKDFDKAKEEAKQGVQLDELSSWIMAFCVACIIWKFGADIIKVFGGTVSGLALGLLA